jgi:hypothetical protein
MSFVPDIYGGEGVYGGYFQKSLQFYDETGLNPLPAGIFVQLFPAGQPYNAPSTLISSGWTEPLGMCSAAVGPDTQYTAVFGSSFQAPSVTATFEPDGVVNPFPVTVAGYRSPSFSQGGYTQQEMSTLVNLWYTQGKVPGAIANSIGQGFGAGLALLDLQVQQTLAMQRLQYCVGPNVDSWSLDFVGPMFVRYNEGGVVESDANFISRNMVMVQRPKCSIAYITLVVQTFYNSIAGEPGSIAAEGQLATDVAGALDVAGGLNINPPVSPPPTIVVPPVYVWDGMTQPGLAQSYGLQPGQFVIQIGSIAASMKQVLALNVAGGLNISGAFNVVPADSVLPKLTTGAPDIRLALLINLISKGSGFQPLYLLGSPY